MSHQIASVFSCRPSVSVSHGNVFLVSLYIVPSEEVIIRKERASGCYRLSAYFFAKCLSEIPLIIIHPIIFLFLFYWLCGLNPSVAFLGQALNVVVNALLAQVRRTKNCL